MTVINGAFSNRSFPVHSFLPPQLGKPKNPYLSQVSDSSVIKSGDINFADSDAISKAGASQHRALSDDVNGTFLHSDVCRSEPLITDENCERFFQVCQKIKSTTREFMDDVLDLFYNPRPVHSRISDVSDGFYGANRRCTISCFIKYDWC